MTDQERLDRLFAEIRACTVCAAHLPLGPRPVIRGEAPARLMIISQAPGTRVHETGLSFNDRSGDVLREWLGIGREIFYDERRIAIMPMGLCYPGRAPGGGDLPPCRDCAPLWHPRVRPLLPEIRLTLLVGSCAVNWYLGGRRKKSLAETVATAREYLPDYFPLPHPSWRNLAWVRRNPWFTSETLPALRQAVRPLL